MTDRAVIYARQSRNSGKSINDQLMECRQDTQDLGLDVVAELQDGRSASRYAGRKRENWPLVLAMIERGGVDVVVLWEASRGDRELTTWSAFLDLCRDQGVRLRVVNDERTYDLGVGSDWRMLASAGVDSAHESEKMSKRIRRGVTTAAAAGRPPAGPCPYGYRRTYDPATGVLVGQDTDPDTAPIVAEIITRVGNGDPVSTIVRDLNERGVTPPGGGREWYRQRVTTIATSQVYAGRRVHQPGRKKGERAGKERATHEASWPAIVTEAEHYAAVRVLANPSRSTSTRPGRQVHLLTWLAECGKCSTPLVASGNFYGCPVGCAQMIRARVDEYVQEVLLAYLSRDDIYALLRKQGEDSDAQVLAARDEVARLRQRLDEWKAAAIAETVTPESFAEIEAGLLAKIASANAISVSAGIPVALRGILEPGADVRARWDAAPLQAKRAILRLLVTVRLVPGRNRYAAIEDRVKVVPR